LGLSHERLINALAYDRETGIFRWRVQLTPRAKIGSVAGWVNDAGYCQIRLDGISYAAHRLAWFYVYGKWPSKDVDHIRGLSNRIDNLREATTAQNARNRTRQRNNTSGYKGVAWHKGSGKWAAQIGVDGRLRYLGVYDTKEAAYRAYCKAAEEMHQEFARVA